MGAAKTGRPGAELPARGGRKKRARTICAAPRVSCRPHVHAKANEKKRASRAARSALFRFCSAPYSQHNKLTPCRYNMGCGYYLSEPDIVVKVVDRLVPTAVTAPMMTTAIKAAINPYSIAVAPPSWRTNCLMRF